MPVYEFACNTCGAAVSVFIRSMSSAVNGRCERCGSTDLRRLVSRFAVIRSAAGGDLGALDDESMLAGFDENDPRAMAAWMRRMQRETGEDMGPEFDEMVGRLERGESLDDELGGIDDHGHDDDFGAFDDV
jgi:putative FmdB family regulatory protein